MNILEIIEKKAERRLNEFLNKDPMNVLNNVMIEDVIKALDETVSPQHRFGVMVDNNWTPWIQLRQIAFSELRERYVSEVTNEYMEALERMLHPELNED